MVEQAVDDARVNATLNGEIVKLIIMKRFSNVPCTCKGLPSHCKLHIMHVFLDCADVSNSEFVCGKAEDVMPQLQKDMKFWEEAVGVVDPPRAGLRK